jgi:hypothetical protein
MTAFYTPAEFRLSAALLLVSIAGCSGDDPNDPGDPVAGSIQVDVTTSGADLDPDGYLVSLDGSALALPLPVSGSASFPDVEVGEHTVAFSGLASNCTADAGSRNVNVVAGDTAAVAFAVSCSAIPPALGSIRIVTSTTGSNSDADGYTFAIDDGPTQAIPTTSAARLDDVAPGDHSVALSGLASNCGLTGIRSRGVTVRAGETADAVFTVTCHAMGPSASQSTIQVDPASITIGFPGMIFLPMSMITVTVLDGDGTPLPGMEVTVTASGTGNDIGPSPSFDSKITNASGMATFALSSTMPEVKTVTAVANGVPLAATPVITVVKSQTFVGMRSFDPEPSMAGETVVVTAVVSGVLGMRPEGGTVSVRSNLEPEAGCDAVPVSPAGSTYSEATCEMTLNVVSTHILTATYSGDIQFEPNTSTAVEHVVIAP